MPPSIESAALLHQLAAHGNDLHAVCEETTPAAASAVYSPSEETTAALDSTPASFSAAQAAMEWVKIAIWLFSRAGERCLVALKAQLGYIRPAPSLASSKTSLAACEFS